MIVRQIVLIIIEMLGDVKGLERRCVNEPEVGSRPGWLYLLYRISKHSPVEIIACDRSSIITPHDPGDRHGPGPLNLIASPRE